MRSVVPPAELPTLGLDVAWLWGLKSPQEVLVFSKATHPWARGQARPWQGSWGPQGMMWRAIIF